jgi:hypothetical protein
MNWKKNFHRQSFRPIIAFFKTGIVALSKSGAAFLTSILCPVRTAIFAPYWGNQMICDKI